MRNKRFTLTISSNSESLSSAPAAHVANFTAQPTQILPIPAHVRSFNALHEIDKRINPDLRPSCFSSSSSSCPFVLLLL